MAAGVSLARFPLCRQPDAVRKPGMGLGRRPSAEARMRPRGVVVADAPGRHRQLVLGWAAFAAGGRRCGDGYAAAAATPLTSAHVSKARVRAARYWTAVTWSRAPTQHLCHEPPFPVRRGRARR